MVPILGVPFLARTLHRLKDAGIRDVILPAGYLPQQIIDFFGDGSAFGLNVTYVIEETPLGTAGALKNVEQYIKGPFFVLNGDVLTSLDLSAMIRSHNEKGGIGTIHLIHVEDPSAFGCVLHDANGRVTSFIEKPPKDNAPTDEVNAGTYLFEKRVLDYIPAGRNVSIERETFPLLIDSGEALYAYTTNDYWMDLGTPDKYLEAHRDILARQLSILRSQPDPSGEGAPALLDVTGLSLPIHADAGSFVHPTAEIGANVVIGAGSSIGARAVVRESVLWDAVIIEDEAVVEGSILATGARIGKGAKVGEGSVIGHHTTVAPGTTVEPNSRLGSKAPLTHS